jgi:hypothetical protein
VRKTPWRIEENSDSCPSSKPYAVVKKDDGKVQGCHPTREKAQEQVVALYAKKGKAAGPAAREKLKPLIEHYMSKPHPFTSCVRDNEKRFGKDRAERICATLKRMGQGKE